MHEQPLSMIGTQLGGHKLDEKLLAKILEASERKKQLIRDLLSPQEYDSLALNDELSFQDQDSGGANISTESAGDTKDCTEEELPAQHDCIQTKPICSRNSWSLRQSVEQKREAIEFFLGKSSETTNQSPDLSFELRSGHYLNSGAGSDQQIDMFKIDSFKLENFICGIIYFLGLNSLLNRKPENRESNSQLTNLYDRFGFLPFTGRKDVAKSGERLNTDNETSMDQIRSVNSELDLSKTVTKRVYLELDDSSVMFVRSPIFMETIDKAAVPYEMDLIRSEQMFTEPSIPSFIRVNTRKNLADMIIDPESSISIGNLKGRLQLTTNNLLVRKHPLLSSEELLSVSAFELGLKLERMESDLAQSMTNNIKLIDQKLKDDSNADFTSLNESIKHIRDNVAELNSLKQQLLSAKMEIETRRSEQKYRNSSIEIETVPEPEAKLSDHAKDLKSRLKKIIELTSEEDFYAQLEQQIDLMEQYSTRIKFSSDNDSNLPDSEKIRRDNFNLWVKSIKIRLLIDENLFYDISPSSELTDKFSLELKSNPIEIPQSENEVNLSIQLLQQTFIPFRWQQVAHSEPIQLSDGSNNFVLKTNDESIELGLSISVKKICLTESERSKQIRVKPEAPVQTNVNADQVLVIRKSVGLKDCDIAPNDQEIQTKTAEQEQDLKPESNLVHETGEFGCQDAENLRHKLLCSRWLNKSSQIVYLSERENSDRSSIERIKSVIQEDANKMDAERLTEGLQSIEQLRRIATEELRKIELDIRTKLTSIIQKSIKRKVALSEQILSIEHLMAEPELRLGLLLGHLRPVYSWPKALFAVRAARRPLMPKRNVPHSDETEDLAAGIEEQLESKLSSWRHLIGDHEASRLQIVVTVQQASNLPMRVVQTPVAMSRPISPLLMPSQTASAMSLANQRQLISPTPVFYLVQPTSYVELVFQRKQQATSLALGKNPSWNETLFLPIECPIDRIGDQLASESIQLNLYDHVCYPSDAQRAMDSLAWDSLHATPSHGPIIQTMQQRIERRLLGQLRVPLSTILSSGRIEASFALKQPLLLDDYQFELDTTLSPSLLLDSRGLLTNTRAHESRISLFITLDPPISLPNRLVQLPLESHEENQVHELAQLWERVALNQRPGRRRPASLGAQQDRRLLRHNLRRHVRALVLRPDGKYCLILRLIGPLRPPLKLLLEDTGMQSQDHFRLVARFVALMSPVKYGFVQMRSLATQLWFDSRQLIEQHLGANEELAVLLCNYFLHLGRPSGLLLGDAVPQGRCVFVLVWHSELGSTQGQLQLEASKLLDSLGGLTSESTNEEPVNRSQFIDRLPILINAGSVQLWDPQEGRCYSIGDQSPLISVGSIVTPENVYANIQAAEQPREVNFDIRLKNLWLPLFEVTVAQPSIGLAGRSTTSASSVMRRQLVRLAQLKRDVGRPTISHLQSLIEPMNYYQISDDECLKLRDHIEKSIKWNLLQWRPNQPTYFNRTLSRLLAEKLAQFEVKSVENPPVDWRHELADLIRSEVLMAHVSASPSSSSHQLISCPLNTTYTGMRPLVEAIYASGVHNAEIMLGSANDLTNQQQQQAFSSQFLVACHVHPYPARLVSVWLYVAAVVPQRRL